MARSIEQRGHHVTCALIGASLKLSLLQLHEQPNALTTLEYELVDHTNGGIQKVRVEPATRSAVALVHNENISVISNSINSNVFILYAKIEWH